ncbi:hypothetical protein [Methyloglobulus sp.]|uniref:hypothetical protein n=1 Tax=Methyloglobulus sp. TaxID=2518622 RepID=UPI0039897F0B
MLAISPDLPRLLVALLAKQDIPVNQRSSYHKHVTRMELCGIRGSVASIIPDYTAFHPGYVLIKCCS